MFYQELLKISKDSKLLSTDLIEQLDSWLATLPNEFNTRITVTKVSNTFNIEYDLARIILEKLCDLKVLERTFAILCPNCNHVLKVTDESNLIENMNKIDFCYSCNSEDFKIDAKNIEVRYKLVKKPKDPEKMKNMYQNILGKEYVSEEDSINSLITKANYNTNNIFYNPTEEEYKELERLFCGVNQDFKNTKSKGDSFEDLVLYLIERIHGLKATKKARTSTNQLDCYVINNNPSLSNKVLDSMGNTFICECKNEDKTPKNDYFHKLADILNQSNEKKFGIFFSKRKVPSTYSNMAYKSFLQNHITIICFNIEELKEIIFDKVNFLSYIQYKIIVVQDDLNDCKEIRKDLLINS